MLGFDRGPTHIELILAEDGPRVVEVNPRMRGRGLSYMTSQLSEWSIHEAVLLEAVGDEPRWQTPPRTGYAAEHAVLCRVPAGSHQSEGLNRRPSKPEHLPEGKRDTVKITILTRALSSLDEAHTCYINAMRELGHAVSIGALPTLGVVDDRIVAATVDIDRPMAWHDSIAESPAPRPVDDVDLVWVLGQPCLPMTKDVWQLLWMLNQRARFVNDVAALMFLNTKNALSLAVPREALPFTVVSDDGMMGSQYQSRKIQRTHR